MKYHKEEYQNVLKDLNSSLSGLSIEEVKKRLNKDGLNEIKNENKKSIIKLLLKQFKEIMLIILMISGVISILLKEYSDSIIIFIVVLLNALLNFIQEYKAEKEVENLKKLSTPKVNVRRENKLIEIPSNELVKGDIIYLKTGDIISADIRLIECSNLKVDESSLTGESINIEKSSKVVKDAHNEIDYSNIAYSGTIVTYGHAMGVVINTGMNTEIGKIAKHLTTQKEELTPLQLNLKELSKKLTLIVLFIIGIIMILGLMQKHKFLEMLLIAVSIGVAAIPEGLPTVVTISLALSISKMAKKNAIIRKLSSVETLGASEIICTDKTGTLTENKMSVKEIYLNGNTYKEENNLEKEKYNNVFFITSSLCNSLLLDSSKVQGDSLEKALYLYSLDKGYNKDNLLKDYKFISEIPFDSKRKMMSTQYKYKDKYYTFTKGAYDFLINKCTRKLKNGEVTLLTKLDKEEINSKLKYMASNALRIIALAYKEENKVLSNNNLEENLIFIGLVGLIDPPRKDVYEAIRVSKDAGIRIIMLTGDHKDTATAIAKDLKIIKSNDEVIEGKEIDKMNDEELDKALTKYNVFSRVNPSMKLRIVTSLQNKKKVVAMTGDGINDAPALKKADIGIAMGKTGTEVAKSSSSMVLKDDNFSTIIYAIKEGRKLYSNITKSILFLLACNLGEIFTLLIGTFFNVSILLPIHILWMNLATDTLPALALSNEKEENDLMKQKPRPKNINFLNKNNTFQIIYQGIIQGLLTLLSFFIGKMYFSNEVGQTMAFITIIFIQLFHSLNMRSLDKSIFKIGHNIYLYLAILITIILQFIIILNPYLASVFKVVTLNIYEWLIAIGLALLIIPLVEIVKYISKKK